MEFGFVVGFSGDSDIKNLPAMQETRVWPLGQEDPLKKGMATHSSILDWRIPWTEEPRGLQSMGSQRVGHDWSNSAHSTLTAQSVGKGGKCPQSSWPLRISKEGPSLEKDISRRRHMWFWHCWDRVIPAVVVLTGSWPGFMGISVKTKIHVLKY